MAAADGRRLPFVGLTGGIGAGKTEALRALDRLGAETLSSDDVVHDLLHHDDEVRDAIVDRLGEDVAPGGGVDRSKVAEKVFESEDDREWLEGLLWPRVGERIAAWRDELSRRDEPPRAAVVEVPLLFEAGMEDVFDATIAVVADDEVRERRTGERGHAGGERRERRQLSQDEKAQRADFAVDNDADLTSLEERMSEVLSRLEP
jgi:dephospho-CoA kinase